MNYFDLGDTDPTGEAVVTVAIFTIGIGKGLSNLCLSVVYGRACLDCKTKAGTLIDRAATHYLSRKDPPDTEGYTKWLQAARPGAECNDLCWKAGEKGINAIVWVVGGVGIKYAITWGGRGAASAANIIRSAR